MVIWSQLQIKILNQISKNLKKDWELWEKQEAIKIKKNSTPWMTAKRMIANQIQRRKRNQDGLDLM